MFSSLSSIMTLCICQDGFNSIRSSDVLPNTTEPYTSEWPACPGTTATEPVDPLATCPVQAILMTTTTPPYETTTSQPTTSDAPMTSTIASGNVHLTTAGSSDAPVNPDVTSDDTLHMSTPASNDVGTTESNGRGNLNNVSCMIWVLTIIITLTVMD